MIATSYIIPDEDAVFVDGTGDSTQGLQEAIDLAVSTGITLFIRRGLYRVTSPLSITIVDGGPFSLMSDFAVFLWGGPALEDAVMTVSTGNSMSSFRLEGIVLDGNDIASHGLRVAGGFRTPLCEVRQVVARRCSSAAILLDGAGPGVFRNCGANLSRVGWWLSRCDRTQLHCCEARYQIDEEGILIDGAPTDSTFGPALLSPHVEGTGKDGIWIGKQNALDHGPTGVTIRDGYLEAVGSTSPAISLDGSVRACLIQGMRIVSSDAPTNAIVYDSDAEGVIADTAISVRPQNLLWGDFAPSAKMIVTGTMLAGLP